MKKILIIKLSAIGDVIMSLSMIDALKKYYDDNVHVTWLCGEIVAPILKEINDINQVLTLNEKNLFSSSKVTQINEMIKIWKKLSFERFDKVIIAHNDWRYRLLALSVLSNEKVAFGYNQHKMLPLGTRYHGVDYVHLATDELFIQKYKLKYPNLSLKRYENYIFQNQTKKVLIFPGGANNVLNEQFLRRWDIKNYQQLAIHLTNNGFQVIIAGANSDSWVSEYFDKNILNVIGKTNLLETISLIQQCDIVVTHDSGPLHLSLYLAKKKTIALFGPVLSEARVPNDYEEAIVIKTDTYLNCMPCYDGKDFAKCDDNLCMKGIDFNYVYETVRKSIL